VAEADRLLRRIDYLTEKLRYSDTLPSRERSTALRRDQELILARLNAARTEYEDRMRKVARADSRGRALLGASRVSLVDIRRSLRPNQVLLEYFATQRGLFTFLVASDTVLSVTANIKIDELARRVRLASQIMSKPSGASDRPIMRALHDVVIGELARSPQYTRATSVIVVTHSALAYLPFAGLVQPDGRRLIESRSLVLLPSAASLPVMRGNEAIPSASISAVFAPFPVELRGSAEEARVVKRWTNRARVFLGKKATEAQLRDVLAGGGSVHVASHAVLNQTTPMFSRIELAPGRADTPRDNGSLDLHELLQMRIVSGLVYLSGCETGAGTAWSTAFKRSEDYATLAQAILYAGAHNVVATLWRIDDTGASVFADRFYAALSTTSPEDALASAQRSMLRDPKYSAARYWAAYTISGSGVKETGAQFTKAASVQ
jgi:CHAT domain-containing protein